MDLKRKQLPGQTLGHRAGHAAVAEFLEDRRHSVTTQGQPPPRPGPPLLYSSMFMNTRRFR